MGEPECDPEPETNGENGDGAPAEEPSEAQPEEPNETPELEPVRRYPSRARKPPTMYGY